MASSTPSKVDVLIVGAGPAGLMLALWLSRLGVVARIVDKRTDKVYSGQADGFQARTLEILDSFGIGERVWKEANQMYEASFWNPDPAGRIRCNDRAPNNAMGLSRFTESVLHQGRMETFFLDAIAASYPHPACQGQKIRVERKVIPTSLSIDEQGTDDEDAYPVTVTLRHLTEAEATPTQRLSNLADGLFRSNLGEEDDVPPSMMASSTDDGRDAAPREEEVVKAKYVVGCDGAHSWTRKALGEEYEMRGEMTDFIWGVLDIVPITDFPDIRTRCMIHSASSGTLMIIPRENRLVRLYIQLTEVSAGSSVRVDRSKITPEMIFKAARKIISPYKLDYHYCDWWTAYQIGQRVGDKFSKLNRVFLAGDAVHTHSPKAGQGMNVSMQDTYNLGWKLGLVCKKVARPGALLPTYELERKQIADDLIAFDRRLSRLFSGRPAEDIMDETGVSMDEFAEAFNLSHMFTSGIGVDYRANVIVAKPEPEQGENGDAAGAATNGRPVVVPLSTAQSTPSLARNCKPGTRFPSFQVIAHSDARPWQMHHKMPSDGRFRIVVFGGDVFSPSSSSTSSSSYTQKTPRERRLKTLNDLGAWLTSNILDIYPRLDIDIDTNQSSRRLRTERDPSIVDVLLLLHLPHTPQQQSTPAERKSLDLLNELHEIYHPYDAKLGWDYDKVLVDAPSYHAGHGRAYEGYGVDPDVGCVVVVRPDGYVGLVAALGKRREGWEEVGRYLGGVLVS
ncbi:FAD binding domain-containing protein [Xylariaceae sp. FL0594]|nr:FAD binding domain-containing protein [Xylariaceae sp. FL0594]